MNAVQIKDIVLETSLDLVKLFLKQFPPHRGTFPGVFILAAGHLLSKPGS